MAKAELKTKKTVSSVDDFINRVKDDQKRKDSFTIVKMMQKATGNKPKMWGGAIIGFGDVHLKYESGRELDWFKIGFSPRKQNLTLYVLCDSPAQNDLLKQLGKHKRGGSCLYINNLDDVDLKVLEEIISSAKIC